MSDVTNPKRDHADRQAVITVLRGPLPKAAVCWTHRLIAQASKVPFARVRAACVALRNQGKLHFDGLRLSDSMVDPESVAGLDLVRVPDAALLPDRPTGYQLYAEIQLFCAAQNMSFSAFGRFAKRSTDFAFAMRNRGLGYPVIDAVQDARRAMGTAHLQTYCVEVPESSTKYLSKKYNAESEPGPEPDLDARKADAATDREARIAYAQKIAENEAREAGDRRARARQIGSVKRGEAVARAAVIEPSTLIRDVRADFPDLWARITVLAENDGDTPGALAIRALRAGVDIFEEVG